MGFIAMKALCGGLLTDAKAVFMFFEGMEKAVPIYGMQRESELLEFAGLAGNPQEMTKEISLRIQSDKNELQGNFCRGCGYCLPCPADIKINMVARMSFLLRRAVWQSFVTPEWQAEMRKVNDCIDCGWEVAGAGAPVTPVSPVGEIAFMLSYIEHGQAYSHSRSISPFRGEKP